MQRRLCGTYVEAITTAATMYFQSYGQRKVRPTEANLIYTTQPAWAILFAYWFLDERLDVATVPAVGLLLCSIGLSLFETNENDEDNVESRIDDNKGSSRRDASGQRQNIVKNSKQNTYR